jgi:hypothetical protein
METIGAVGVTATPVNLNCRGLVLSAASTNPFVAAARKTSCPYKLICRSGLGTAPTNNDL